MNNNFKYIVDSLNGFAIFPPYVDHDAIGRAMQKRGAEPISAGFIEIAHGGEVQCFGKSHSLGLVSRGEEDAKIVIAAFDLLPIE